MKRLFIVTLISDLTTQNMGLLTGSGNLRQSCMKAIIGTEANGLF